MTNIATGRVNFGPIHHSILGSSLGYDSMFDELERMLNAQPTGIDKYPPHNILKLDEYNYVVELAVAGFSKDEIDITINDGKLIIKGEKNGNEATVEYLHKGISNRSFTKTISMVDSVEVRGAEYADGILRISLENVIPESKKPRKIDITYGGLPLVEPTVKELLTEDGTEKAPTWKEIKYAGAGNPKTTGAGI